MSENGIRDRLDADMSAVIGNIAASTERTVPCLFSSDVNISELAALAVSECDSRDDLQAFISDAEEVKIPETAKIYQNEFTGYCEKRIRAVCKIDFYRHVANASGKKLFSYISQLIERADEVASRAKGKIAYVQSVTADSAFLQFSASGLVEQPKAVYFSGFSDVCEEVYNGLCEYCILPVENSRDGKLRGFCALIDKYDLQIQSVCEVYSPDKSVLNGVALLKKRGLNEKSIVSKPHSDQLLEISVSTGTYPAIADILAAAEFCGLEPLMIDSVPVSGNSFADTVVFSLKTADLAAFLIYLSFEIPQCNIIGLYKKTRAK